MPEASYEYIVSNGHHLAVVDGLRLIIDTGTPISFVYGAARTLTIGGRTIALSNNVLGIEKEAIDTLVGTETDGFLGMDCLLATGGILLDKGKNLITFGAPVDGGEGEEIPLTAGSVFGQSYLTVPLSVNGIGTTALLDTGAKIGYAARRLVAGCAYLGTAEDFSPSFGGAITARQYRVRVESGSFAADIPLAEMTPLMEASLGIMGSEAILGINDFPADRIGLDLIGSKIILWR